MNYNVFGQARTELDRISQHINGCSSCVTCEAQKLVNTLRDLVSLIEKIDGRSPTRWRLMGVVQEGLNIDSVSTGGPTPPGAVLTESMTALEVTVKELAERTGYSKKTIGDLRANKVLPSHRCALALEKAGFGTAEQWNRLASAYKDWLLRQQKEKK